MSSDSNSAKFAGAAKMPARFTQEELQSMLPPSVPWDGGSMQWALPADHEWATETEASDFKETADNNQVVAYAKRLVEASEHVSMRSIAKMPNGEDILLMVVAKDCDHTPEGLKASGKPTLFLEGGIHPGESIGINGGLMMVRNLTITPLHGDLLDKINLIYIPVLNINGHWRQSDCGRINQHGPNTSGRRVDGNWLNPNRDFGKLDSIECRTSVKVMDEWDPDFFIDAHSTDGMNYQYDVTWSDNGDAGLSNNIHKWLRSEMNDLVHDRLEALGHVPGPCIDTIDPLNPDAGYYPYYTDGPAFSTNYADGRQLPAYLLEMHALKPYKQRMMAAYAFYVAVAEVLGQKGDSLKAAIKADREARIDPVPVAWTDDDPVPTVEFKSNGYEIVMNETVGCKQIIWNDEPVNRMVPCTVRSTPLNPVKRPKFYYVPAVWREVIERIECHGIKFERLTAPETVHVTRYHMQNFKIDDPNREGRATASADAVPVEGEISYRAGDIKIPTDQPLGTLAISLLEPTGESSFFYWGFFNSQMANQEFGGENYIMIPMAEKMLKANPDLAKEWADVRAANPEIVEDLDAVAAWFFERTEYYDHDSYMLPIGVQY